MRPPPPPPPSAAPAPFAPFFAVAQFAPLHKPPAAPPLAWVSSIPWPSSPRPRLPAPRPRFSRRPRFLQRGGFDVTVARNSIDAENELGSDFDVVISEVDIKPLNGFELLKKVRSGGNEVPFVFHSKNAEGDSVQRGFELGAADFITKPASPDLVALKVTRVLDGAGRAKRKSGGVSGSLTEMALPDVVQILFHGRKSGKLTIAAEGKRGEILFCDGMIFDATFGERAHEEAFYAMLRLRDGDFELDPNFRPTEQVI